MLPLIPPSAYARFRPFFSALHLAYVAEAIIAGNSPAVAWADDLTAPRAILVWDRAHCIYLAGEPSHDTFRSAVRAWVGGTLLPAAGSRRLGLVKIYFASPAWEPELASLFPGLSLERGERVLYRLDRPALPDWRSRVPQGLSIRRIDRALLHSAAFDHAQAVVEEIESCWNSLDLFLERGFGYCALAGNAVAGWCTAEYVSAGQCGTGVETVEAYQNRGLATLMAAAFVEHCAAAGLQTYWDSWKRNLPSVAVAQKVGFQKVLDDAVYAGEIEREESR